MRKAPLNRVLCVVIVLYINNTCALANLKIKHSAKKLFSKGQTRPS
ncbi:hypothetical protein PESP_a1642 [Pseudoalteromonas espejiana DSM 9414]|nr:hypothetical protein PESP_a1642 [Pseudoalteromonas espejiana DSM 9414]